MSRPVVTFLVLCQNHARYLRECVASILAQSFIDFEVLILDDASLDKSQKLAVTLCMEDVRVRYYRHDKEIGHTANVNFGLEQAQGDLVWLISAKDALAFPTVLQDFVTLFLLNPKLGFAFCRMQCLDEESQPLDAYIPHQKNSELPYHPTLYPGRAFFTQLVKANFVPAASTIARKVCYEQYGGYHPELTHSGDWLALLKLCLDWDVYFDPVPKVYSREIPPDAYKLPDSPRKILENALLCYQELERFLQERNYPETLKRTTRTNRLQFMRKHGFPLSMEENWRWLYHSITDRVIPSS